MKNLTTTYLFDSSISIASNEPSTTSLLRSHKDTASVESPLYSKSLVETLDPTICFERNKKNYVGISSFIETMYAQIEEQEETDPLVLYDQLSMLQIRFFHLFSAGNFEALCTWNDYIKNLSFFESSLSLTEKIAGAYLLSWEEFHSPLYITELESDIGYRHSFLFPFYKALVIPSNGDIPSEIKDSEISTKIDYTYDDMFTSLLSHNLVKDVCHTPEGVVSFTSSPDLIWLILHNFLSNTIHNTEIIEWLEEIKINFFDRKTIRDDGFSYSFFDENFLVARQCREMWSLIKRNHLGDTLCMHLHALTQEHIGTLSKPFEEVFLDSDIETGVLLTLNVYRPESEEYYKKEKIHELIAYLVYDSIEKENNDERQSKVHSYFTQDRKEKLDLILEEIKEDIFNFSPSQEDILIQWLCNEKTDSYFRALIIKAIYNPDLSLTTILTTFIDLLGESSTSIENVEKDVSHFFKDHLPLLEKRNLQ